MDQGGAQVDQLEENGKIKVNTAVCAGTQQEAAVTVPIPPGVQGQQQYGKETQSSCLRLLEEKPQTHQHFVTS